MKRQSKRKLYDSIMSDVSKIVKRHLNEAEEKTDVEKATDTLLTDLKRNKKDLKFAIDFMKIISKGRDAKNYYKGISYDKLIPELEKRLNNEL